ncbi:MULTISPECIES: hypothetical protein [unclassified Microcystis]|nr:MULTISPECIES: hypothetical protein [unclassified Microcystis]MCA2505503.1 hypothetical protein [Microcystis sp. M62BS1]MCA2523176.1 hypothetical protein [Microcystis sp. M63BS1]MCA2548957.1 hypothetical protein [Microcystis sp. M53BS1]MCA2608402.1 hypothetical protein [Microcystis sp. M27BS1]MCA2518275.1 hypothetical protein [Microcystis sp. M59BS1]
MNFYELGIRNYELGSGEVGRWGDGEVGKWGVGCGKWGSGVWGVGCGENK